jgi:hypothetical protein
LCVSSEQDHRCKLNPRPHSLAACLQDSPQPDDSRLHRSVTLALAGCSEPEPDGAEDRKKRAEWLRRDVRDKVRRHGLDIEALYHEAALAIEHVITMEQQPADTKLAAGHHAA